MLTVAAVVGVILSSTLVVGAAFVALYRFKIDVLWVVLIGGALGLGKSFLFE